MASGQEGLEAAGGALADSALATNRFNRAKVGNAMNWTFGLSLASLIYGVLFYILTIAVLGTPPADIGMVSTTVVFLLFGIFGLLLHRVQSAAAATA